MDSSFIQWVVILYQHYFIAQFMRPVEAPFKLSLLLFEEIQTMYHLYLHWYLIISYFLIFSSFLRGRYADFTTAYASLPACASLPAYALWFKIKYYLEIHGVAAILSFVLFSPHISITNRYFYQFLYVCAFRIPLRKYRHMGDIYSYLFPTFNTKDSILNLSFFPQLTIYLSDPFISEYGGLPYLFYSSIVIPFYGCISFI